jgi:hypothetical protein
MLDAKRSTYAMLAEEMPKKEQMKQAGEQRTRRHIIRGSEK